MIQARKLGHVVLKVRDVQKSKEFYTRALGLKVAYDHIADLYLTGKARWAWVVNQVAELVIGIGYSSEAFEQPLGELWGIDDDLRSPGSRTEDELAGIVRQACIEQVRQ